jgi:CDP-diacylglycerol--serine O-phosphatidyltransferase
VLLPIYVSLLGSPRLPLIAFLYTLLIAILMVSRLPVYSGKKVGTRVPPEMVLPIFVVVVLFVALLLSYPWEVLTVGTICYLASLPVSFMSYRRQEARDAAAASAIGAPEAPAAQSTAGAAPVMPPATPDEERPARLN